MSKILLISDSPSKIEGIYSKVSECFNDAKFFSLLISENITPLSTAKSFFISSAHPHLLKIDEIVSFIKLLEVDFIFGSSDIKFKSFLSILASALNTAMLSDISEIIRDENGKVFFLKPYIKNIMAKLYSLKRPTITSIIAGEKNSDFKYLPEELKIETFFPIQIEKNQISLNNNIERARKVIGIGRGVRKEDMDIIKKFAQKINALIGYTRPAREELGVPYEYQIGVSGKIITPDLYIALGISGKEYHLRGILNSKKIIAVNTDPQAPIKNYADYFINSDYKVFIEKLI